jgi:hypothetical protein
MWVSFGMDNSGQIVSTSSNHTGGANHSRADGSVAFVSNSVSTTNTTGVTGINVWAADSGGNHPVVPAASPYGVYGAMGTIAGGEAVSL